MLRAVMQLKKVPQLGNHLLFSNYNQGSRTKAGHGCKDLVVLGSVQR